MSETTENENDENREPWFEPEDCEACLESGTMVEPEWEWDAKQGVYVCSGCGAVQ